MIVVYNTTLRYENVNKSIPCLLQILQMEIKCSPKVRILRRPNSQTLWSLAKLSHLKQGGQDVRLIFFIGKFSWLLNRIFTDVCFAYKEKEIQHR